ncbi:MAG: outer membrane transport energization protein tonb [Bacteroidetes bacterium]|nr:MAG: outer membrane transport energization protein tonb [Bacteroidota bacterium]
MNHPETKDRNAVYIALGSAAVMMGLILALFWYITIVSPVPPFPEAAENVELIADNGISDENGGGYTNPGGGSTQGDGGQTQTSGGSPDVKGNPDPNAGGNITNDADPTIAGSSGTKPNNTPEASDKLKELMNSLGQNNNTSTTPTGNNGTGDPYSSGGDGGGKGNGNGPGLGPGTGGPTGVGPGLGFQLRGRKVENRPTLINPTQEEGLVKVEIVVDRTGRVIRATPLSAGSTTTDSRLRALARQNALQWRFDPNPNAEEEQIGSITFNFVLK